MPTTQRIGRIETPLGPDVLLLRGFEGSEGLSELFQFDLYLMTEKEKRKNVAFDKILGQSLTVEFDILPGQNSGSSTRYINGICCSFEEGYADDEFTFYRARMLPAMWFLTRQTRSRIFQQKSVPDILKAVFTGMNLEVSIQGNFEKREYCVQYRETDFAFACRLMEEEGIFYFFKHAKGSHKLVLANSSQSHQAIESPVKVPYAPEDQNERQKGFVSEWRKTQELRSGKVTLRDYNFQLPENALEAKKTISDDLVVGAVTHKLKVGPNSSWELYDFPGGYGVRFDGIDKGGGEASAELNKLNQDNQRTADLRMGAEAVHSLQIEGSSNCNHFLAGSKFTLDRHPHGNGDYVFTRIFHEAMIGASYRSGEGDSYAYSNRFTCIPLALPFRPPRNTPKPLSSGPQTAVVVGPSGEEIFTDKYGRVKVQFHWDREGKNDANSSCWLRVATLWAGKQWGMIHLPRIGQEVIVDFLEGNLDAPIISGSVYNPKNMPPYTLPDKKTQSGVRSRSTLRGGPANFNEIRFEDKNGSEQVFINAEKDLDLRVENDSRAYVGSDSHVIVKGKRVQEITGNENLKISGDQVQSILGKMDLKVGSSRQTKVEMKDAVDAGMEIHLKSGMKVVVEAGLQISLKVGGNFIDISPAGIAIQGTMVMINSGGAAGAGGGASPEDPGVADVADDGSKATKLS